jgi:hypothetical protein
LHDHAGGEVAAQVPDFSLPFVVLGNIFKLVHGPPDFEVEDLLRQNLLLVGFGVGSSSPCVKMHKGTLLVALFDGRDQSQSEKLLLAGRISQVIKGFFLALQVDVIAKRSDI